MRRVDSRSIALDIAFRWYGRYYIWGGDDPSGFDCSGFIVEILKSVGVLPHRSDFTANALYKKFQHLKSDPHSGSLVFWFDGEKASHVEFMINDAQTIGASGGGSPRFSLKNTIEKYPFLKRLIKDEDTVKSNPFLWILERLLYYKEAIERNAYIKIRPLEYRGSNYKIVDPFQGG